PGCELAASRRVMLAERGPLIQPDLQVRLQLQVAQQWPEELEVMTGHYDAEPRREASLSGARSLAGARSAAGPLCLAGSAGPASLSGLEGSPGSSGRHRPGQVAAQPLRG